jgi:hypothetical protein
MAKIIETLDDKGEGREKRNRNRNRKEGGERD